MILDPKRYDPLKEVKHAAAERWVAAVNADGSYGRWCYRMITRPEATREAVAAAAGEALAGVTSPPP